MAYLTKFGKRKETGNGEGSSAPPEIRCQCGDKSYGEQAMIKCNFCFTLQHWECYGYNAEDDYRIPELHACYDCLVPSMMPDNPGLLAEMTNVVLLRKGVALILKEGVSNLNSTFAEKLHCTEEQAREIVYRLRKEYLLTPTRGWNLPGFWTQQKPKFTFVKSLQSVQWVVRHVLDPMLHIKDCYEAPSPAQRWEWNKARRRAEMEETLKRKRDSDESAESSESPEHPSKKARTEETKEASPARRTTPHSRLSPPSQSHSPADPAAKTE
ncbi:hypothetical protein NUU61_008275 [Penicillium alfredii]|uniref:Zinc finger PHD-type domain-containing protein n=1 Tax=Penicillium alfredii TaxID=1506179 RepID=A0A9W9JZ42_9EURO|nr:uncharacterized protein NUU61_008275 [Penicillium alfredii]KAJ5086968.1 hypothetical protein NUU61_008275 [Penicillium alfredii]